MVLVRPQVILAAHGKPGPRASLAATGIQIYSSGGMYWSKKPLIIRNVPYTAANPHAGQIETRIHFGEIASSTAGMPLMERLRTISERMRGYRAPSKMAESEYPSKRHGSYHTLEELKSMLEKKKVAAARFETW